MENLFFCGSLITLMHLSDFQLIHLVSSMISIIIILDLMNGVCEIVLGVVLPLTPND